MLSRDDWPVGGCWCFATNLAAVMRLFCAIMVISRQDSIDLLIHHCMTILQRLVASNKIKIIGFVKWVWLPPAWSTVLVVGWSKWCNLIGCLVVWLFGCLVFGLLGGIVLTWAGVSLRQLYITSFIVDGTQNYAAFLDLFMTKLVFCTI